MDRTKIYLVDLNSPCQELSTGGLQIAVTILVHWQINVSCACSRSAIIFLSNQDKGWG